MKLKEYFMKNGLPILYASLMMASIVIFCLFVIQKYVGRPNVNVVFLTYDFFILLIVFMIVAHFKLKKIDSDQKYVKSSKLKLAKSHH